MATYAFDLGMCILGASQSVKSPDKASPRHRDKICISQYYDNSARQDVQDGFMIAAIIPRIHHSSMNIHYESNLLITSRYVMEYKDLPAMTGTHVHICIM